MNDLVFVMFHVPSWLSVCPHFRQFTVDDFVVVCGTTTSFVFIVPTTLDLLVDSSHSYRGSVDLSGFLTLDMVGILQWRGASKFLDGFARLLVDVVRVGEDFVLAGLAQP